MKNKKTIIVLAIIIVLVVITSLLMSRKKFKIDSDNKYIITTNLKMLTMANDGGTHTNEYYGIDLDKKRVYKYQDSYKGFKGDEYKGKIVKRKILSNEEVSSLQNIFYDVIFNNEKNKVNDINIRTYILDTKNYGEINIYDKEIIDKLVELLE